VALLSAQACLTDHGSTHASMGVVPQRSTTDRPKRLSWKPDNEYVYV